jgi:hypothetical protein
MKPGESQQQLTRASFTGPRPGSLQRFLGEGPLEAPEKAMLDRLTSIADDDMEPTSYDLNFYTHELGEADRYAQLGFGPESRGDLSQTRWPGLVCHIGFWCSPPRTQSHFSDLQLFVSQLGPQRRFRR